MKKQAMFIHGAGEGAYEIDGKLVASVRDALGAEYNVIYPKMPEEERAGYQAWKAQIFFYHSQDDEWVPFAHLRIYAKKLPQAAIRKFDGRGHTFNDDLSEVAADIKGLQGLH